MAEILVEKQICPSCGADVRSGALFCYNCGGAVPVMPEKQKSKNGNGSKPEILERKNAETPELIEQTPEISGFKTTIERADGNTTDLSAQNKLKSAATMRRKPKTLQKKEVEIVWEEQQSPSSLVLIATALLLAIFAAAVIIVAMTLK